METVTANQIQLLLTEYDQTMSGQAWYGEPVWKILDGIDAGCASAQPLPGMHTIWQLVMHMMFWEEVAIRRFSERVEPDLSGNFPSTAALDEPIWRKTLDQFRRSNAKFREALSRLDPATLDQTNPGGKYSFRGEAMGVIQHHIYHVGQIALLKKAYHGAK